MLSVYILSVSILICPAKLFVIAKLLNSCNSFQKPPEIVLLPCTQKSVDNEAMIDYGEIELRFIDALMYILDYGN